MSRPSPQTHRVSTRLDCVAAAREVRLLAIERGQSERDARELEIVALELAQNAVLHGGGGTLVAGVEALGTMHVEVYDSGPGLPPAVIADQGRTDGLGPDGPLPKGTPANGGLGAGLASARRLSDVLSLSNKPEGGARVTARRFARYPANGRRKR